MIKNRATMKVRGKIVSNEELAETARLRLLVEAMADIPGNLGAYPRAVVDSNGKRHERTRWREGWNACSMKCSERMVKLLKRNFREHARELLFLYAVGAGWMRGGKFFLNMNDTFAWGCADAEEVPSDKLKEVVDLYRRYGCSGLIYWVAKRRGMDPDAEMTSAVAAVRRVRKEEKTK